MTKKCTLCWEEKEIPEPTFYGNCAECEKKLHWSWVPLPGCFASNEMRNLNMEAVCQCYKVKPKVATAYGKFVPNFNGGYYKPGGGVRIEDVETFTISY